MKILLIKAACTRYYGQTVVPMGLLYLSSALKKAGYTEIKIIHLDLENPAEEALGRQIAGYKPDIIGISAITAEAVSMHRVAALAKSALPGALIVAGGAHPTGYTADCMQDPNIDAAVRNEGELTFLELVKTVERGEPFAGLAGLSYRKNGAIVNTRRGNSSRNWTRCRCLTGKWRISSVTAGIFRTHRSSTPASTPT